MAGTVEGGRKASAKNKALYGEDFYSNIGAKGGKVSKGGGFGQGEAGRERARLAGAKGGAKSRRGKKSDKANNS